MERISYEFGSFQVNSGEREVRREGKPLPLTPKVFDILLVLIQNPGRILTKDEIMKQVWPDTIVEESNLARNVSTLRKALGEEPDQPQYIETIPWRGYRFLAEVRELRKETETVDSLAVLPFVNEDEDPEAEYLSDGITESLIHKLSLLSNLRVMSRYSVFQYKVRNRGESLPDPKTVGFKLGVRAVLTGRIRIVDDVVLIGVELVDAGDNRHLWGAQYNRELSDIVTLQETISQQISEQLKLKLTSKDRQRLASRQTENPEAYQLYLKGRHFSNRMTLEGVQKGVELFQQAIEKDPAYASAYTGLSACFALLNQPVEARKAAIRALELDPSLGEVHASLGFYNFLYDWDFAGAEREMKQAIELTPNDAQAHQGYATFLACMGRHNEAIIEAKRACELDPLSTTMNQTVGNVLASARNYGAAIDALLHALELDPYFVPVHSALVITYAAKGMYKEALAQFEKLPSLAGGHPIVDANIKAIAGMVHAMASQRTEALKIIEEVSTPPAATSYNIARIYAALGENDRAFEYLDRAYREKSPEMVSLKVDPSFDNLCSGPRFRDLLVRMGFA
jgi:DNA-binding winged helix-turn-helix (wHTH) protein/tetratricopeptide (TPR) repeat protein